MGIKGIYKELGPGERVALTKLAVEKLQISGRPLRLAIDISIWQFQNQAARGGANPAIRNLFYRLLRLLALSIQAIFVFDGPKKPKFKRNKRTGRGDGVASAMAKHLITLFGFQCHEAPGEAEAECALLQRHGIVDAVLSEDVDTLMFGCTKTLRNWSADGTKGSKTPTHVSMYDTDNMPQYQSGLDREGMVLVALMSGGDYLPEGIPGVGVKVACEAAKAGFGKSLCRLKKSDTVSIQSWKETLKDELYDNESGFFRTKHKALVIPNEFPDMEILGYYTHPVVSPAATLDRLRDKSWDQPVNVLGLRRFTAETFDWNYRLGAVKFIRVLAPALLVQKLVNHLHHHSREELEHDIIQAISNRRSHITTGEIPELRLSFIPTKIVGHDFHEEPDEVISSCRDGLALNSDDEFEPVAGEDEIENSTKTSTGKVFNPTETDLLWVPEAIAKPALPLLTEAWEASQTAKAARKTQKATRQKSKPGVVTAGAMDRFVTVTKPNAPITTDPIQEATSQPPLATSSKQNKPKVSKSSNRSRDAKGPHRHPNLLQNTGSSIGFRVSKPIKSSDSQCTDDVILISSSPPSSPTQNPCSPARNRTAPQKNSVNYETQQPAHVSPHASPRKRLHTGGGADIRAYMNRTASPTSLPGETSRQRKQAPMKPATRPAPRASDDSPPRQRAGPTKARDVYGESPEEKGLDAEKEKKASQSFASSGDFEDDSDDPDLPPISRLCGRNSKSKELIPSSEVPAPKLARNRHSDSKPVEPPPLSLTTWQYDEFGNRMTKMYVPRTSQPGFYKEVDMTVDEAEEYMKRQESRISRLGGALGAQRGRALRRSDVGPPIDLTDLS